MKKKKVKPIPDGYHSVTPYLSIRGASEAIEFYKKALGAKEVMRMPGPDGQIGHAEILIGNSRVMLADEHPQMQFVGPATRGGTTVHLHVYVADVDRGVAKRSKRVLAARSRSAGSLQGRSRTRSATSGTLRRTRKTCR
jgi:PhnB protein